MLIIVFPRAGNTIINFMNMAPDNNLPIILLAFANDQGDNSKYLRNLPEEIRKLDEILEVAGKQGLCDYIEQVSDNC